MFVINWILFEIISTIPHSNAIVNRGLLFRCTHIYNMYLWCVGVSASVSVPSTEAAGTLKVCCLSVLRFFPLLLVIVLHDIRYSLMVVVCVCVLAASVTYWLSPLKRVQKKRSSIFHGRTSSKLNQVDQKANWQPHFRSEISMLANLESINVMSSMQLVLCICCNILNIMGMNFKRDASIFQSSNLQVIVFHSGHCELTQCKVENVHFRAWKWQTVTKTSPTTNSQPEYSIKIEYPNDK